MKSTSHSGRNISSTGLLRANLDAFKERVVVHSDSLIPDGAWKIPSLIFPS